MTFVLSVCLTIILRGGYLLNYELNTAFKFSKLIRDYVWIT